MDSYYPYERGTSLVCNKAWYHGDLTRVEAEHALGTSDCDCFLVRESKGNLVLSLVRQSQICHIRIERFPGGYRLQGYRGDAFRDLQDLVAYHSVTPISDDPRIVLGLTCPKTDTAERCDTAERRDTGERECSSRLND